MYRVHMSKRWFVVLVMSVSIWTVSSCSFVNLIPHGIGSESDKRLSMLSESQTESGDGIVDSGFRISDSVFNPQFPIPNPQSKIANPQSTLPNPKSKLRVDSLSVSDAVIVLAAAHRLCEERDSLRRVYVKVLQQEVVDVKRERWLERAVWVFVVVLSLVL